MQAEESQKGNTHGAQPESLTARAGKGKIARFSLDYPVDYLCHRGYSDKHFSPLVWVGRTEQAAPGMGCH